MADLRNIEIPKHLSKMLEFKLLDEVSDEMMSEYEDEMQARYDDVLITTATEIGIARREKILGILPDPEDSLEARRAVVLFWWYNRMPYTRRVLEGKIAALCGTGNYTFDYDLEEKILHVIIAPELGLDVLYAVTAILDRLVMLDIILDIKAITEIDKETDFYIGGVNKVIENISVGCEFTETRVSTMPLTSTGAGRIIEIIN